MTTDTIQQIVNQARFASEKITSYDQQQLDELSHAVAWALMKPEHNQKLSTFAVKDTGYGKVEDKIIKNHRKTLGLLRDLQNVKTTGIVRETPKSGITEFVRPIGVIAALTPSTNPIATPTNKIINALKCGNSIIISASPKGEQSFSMLLQYIHAELKKIEAPEFLVQQMPTPASKQATEELIKLVDLVLVTGSQNNVRKAYSSGTPAIGVGTGNVTTIVDSSADLAQTAHKIHLSKTFDNATSCSSENNLICLSDVYDDLMQQLQKEGGYCFNTEQKAVLQKELFLGNKLNPNLIAKKATEIAKACLISVPENTTFLMVEETKIGHDIMFSRERMSPVLTLYRAKDFSSAKEIAGKLLKNQGAGHSLGIHTRILDQPLDLAKDLPTCRIIVNQAHCFATGGAFNNALPFSLSMGCGSWGGNSIDGNLHYKHFLNTVKVVREIPKNEPSVENVLGDYIKRYDPRANYPQL